MWDLTTINKMNEKAAAPPTISLKQYQRVLEGQQLARRQVKQLREAIEDSITNIDYVEVSLAILGTALDATAPTAPKSKDCGCGD